ncbi:Repeat domain-containing protein [Rubritalea squalenifaciens DSM 18772]|uniref:Repeat domain-containing protein n=1 Tax=Rubritalea squalenifaciens DSM 18772 TaxID=1123071 RepID=A0A1M6NPD1_9BACT|nr:VCBS repeat-containing protein [Rubritalea squalenifaciens]SHJ97545.1 Repeat domain-containing protein [Rubritalea squalenifaciens DSM 18772]
MRLLLTYITLSASLQAAELPPTSVTFTKITLSNKYVSEGASAADIDADGHTDIIAGHLWWKGPQFDQSYSYAPIKDFPIEGPGLEGYSTNFFCFPAHITEDQWPEILHVGLPGSEAKLYINPGRAPFSHCNEDKTCSHETVQSHVCNESPQLQNVLKAEKPQLLSYHQNSISLATPSTHQSSDWNILKISPPHNRLAKYSHGLGCGDINGDSLPDILEKSGWWEQPKNWDKKTPWTFHPYPFAPGKGGSQMYAYDIDGDGDNDVVTALDAHGYGLSWYEQTRNQQDQIDFKAHTIMTDKASGSPFYVCFSQLHAMGCADIDGDGIKDIVTGKCYFAHNGKDPGAHDPAVLYWFRTTRNPDGSVLFLPYLIDSNSGVGRQITCADVNADGKMDIITSSKKGVFIFIQN